MLSVLTDTLSAESTVCFRVLQGSDGPVLSVIAAVLFFYAPPTDEILCS